MRGSTREQESSRNGPIDRFSDWTMRIGGPARAVTVIVAAVAVIVVAGGAVAIAEDDRPVDDPPSAPAAHVQSSFIDLGEDFDRNVFEQPHGGFSLHGAAGPAGPSPAGEGGRESGPGSLAKVRAIADERFARIDALCRLTEPQRRKLRLALESDVRRSAEVIDAVRRKYRGMRVNTQDPAWQKVFQEWQQDVTVCREKLRSVCDGDSLVMKALPTALDADQHAQFVAETNARRDCLWRSIVVRELVGFDTVLGLDERQHEELEALLLAERPRLRVGFHAPAVMFQFAPQLVGLSLARIEDARLASVVSPRQAKLLRQFAQAGVGIRQHIESQGLLEKEP